MKAEPILIQRPERQTRWQRLMFAGITMLAWTFWVSLWLPVLTLIAWLLGVEDVYLKLGLGQPLHSAGDLSLILIAAVSSAMIFGSWALYNHARFSGKQKRRGNRHVTIAETARDIGTSVEMARRLQASRCSTIHFSEDGRLFMAVEGSEVNAE